MPPHGPGLDKVLPKAKLHAVVSGNLVYVTLYFQHSALTFAQQEFPFAVDLLL